MTARSSREEILKDIRRALHGGKGSGSADVRNAADQLGSLVSEIKQNCLRRRAELVQQFESEVTRIGGRFHRAATPESAVVFIEQVAAARKARRIVAWDAQVVDGIDLRKRLSAGALEFVTETDDRALVAAAAAADVGISGVDYALADTGTLVLVASKGQARSISLLPPVHIAVVRPEQVISGLSDLFPLLRAAAQTEGGDLSSAITFITGPSRTADIELTLVVGVHGPQELHVVLLNC